MAQHQVDQLKTGIWSVKELLLILDQLKFLIISVLTNGQKKFKCPRQ